MDDLIRGVLIPSWEDMENVVQDGADPNCQLKLYSVYQLHREEIGNALKHLGGADSFLSKEYEDGKDLRRVE